MSLPDEIRVAMNEPRPIIYETQIESMRRLIGNEKFETMEAWIRNFCLVVDNSAQMQDINDAWARINEQLRNAYLDRLNMTYMAPRRGGKTWLGSQLKHVIFDEHLRIPQVQEVPSVRDLSWTYGPVNAHWENGATTFDHGSAHWSPNEQSDALQLKEWLQLRSVCRRTTSCGVA